VVHVCGTEVVVDAPKHFCDLILLTGEDVQIDVVRLLYKMRGDVGSLYELDESVSCLVALTEVLNLWSTVCLHVYPSDEVLTEPCDRPGATNRCWTGLRDVHDCMDAPRHLT